MDHREELELLVELARSGNMRKAAERLSISQSTLSDAVTRLETNYGAELFERGRRGSAPTVYGSVVVSAAARALSIMDEAQREIGLIRGSESGRLVISSESGLIEPFLVPAIARGLRHYPKLRFRIHATNSTASIREVRDKRIDFFFGIPPDGDTRGLTLRELGVAGIVTFVRPGHPLAGSGPHRLREIMQYPVVHGPAPRWLVKRLGELLVLGEEGEPPALGDASVIVNDFSAVRAVVRQTDTVGVAVSSILSADFAAGMFAEIETPDEEKRLLQIPLIIGTAEDRALPPAALTLIRDLEDVVTELTAERTP
jgi:DNA-binding transcriptional LysR family regulator